MFFDEARSLNQLPYRDTKPCNPGDCRPGQANSLRNAKDVARRFSAGKQTSQPMPPVMTPEMLDSANNRLQELMQLLYLLSRDPGVPQDGRYHVTVAQSEIALLAREIRNTMERQVATADSGLNRFAAAQP